MERSPYVNNLIEMAGWRFGRLLVIEYAGSQTFGKNSQKATWRCICDCGTEVIALAQSMQQGRKKSCGCLLRESRQRNVRRMNEIQARPSGPDHPSWNHDLTDEQRTVTRKNADYTEWRTRVFQRDSYRCVVCGAKGKIHAHHLKSYRFFPESRHDTDNGVTMCHAHHLDFHVKYGKRNFTPADFEEYRVTFSRPRPTEADG